MAFETRYYSSGIYNAERDAWCEQWKRVSEVYSSDPNQATILIAEIPCVCEVVPGTCISCLKRINILSSLNTNSKKKGR